MAKPHANPKAWRVSDIVAAVSHVARIATDAICDTGQRKQPFVNARWAVMVLARECGHTLSHIGRAVGTDHGTVLFSLRRIADMAGRPRHDVIMHTVDQARDLLMTRHPGEGYLPPADEPPPPLRRRPAPKWSAAPRHPARSGFVNARGEIIVGTPGHEDI